jgi:RNA-dependent RNA polymerase
MLHPSDVENESDIPRVWLRPSQTKIKYDKLDPAQLTIDVLRKSYMKTTTRLSAEVIINLAENGVPHKNIIRLFHDGLEEHLAGLTNWDGPNAMLDLYCHVSRIGGVITARLAREAGGEARVRGYSQREAESADADEEDDVAQPDPMAQRSTRMCIDDNGATSSLINLTQLGVLILSVDALRH